MIDPCIYKVYKENQQVFIPEFGAIIKSEVSDSPSFNAMLNFDDGKVIEAIMDKQSISEDEARTLLQEHVQTIKDKIEEGKTHYIRGLGHLYKDEVGSFAVSKKKPSLDFSAPPVENENSADELGSFDSAQEEFDSIESTDIENVDDSTLDEFSSTDQTEEDTEFSSFMASVDEETENQFDVSSDDSEDQFAISDDSSSSEFNEESEDNSWDDDNSEYSYDEENFEEEESYEDDTFYKEEGKGNRVFLTLTVVVVLLFVVAAAGYYFLFYEGGDKTADKKAAYSTTLASSKDDKSKKAANTKETKKDVKAASTSAADQKKASSAVSNQYASADGPFYSVILGSFKIENNANNYQKYLQARGMEVAIFRRDNDFHFVGFEDIPGKSNAVGVLSEMRSEEPTAWVIRKLGQ